MESPPSLRDADVPMLAREAERFLAQHRWCGHVSQVAPIFRANLLEIDPDSVENDA